MLCDICKKNPATITVERYIHEQKETLHICRACAEKILPIKEGTKLQPKWTNTMEKVLEVTREEAKARGVGFIGSEYLLLGLLKVEEGIAFQLLQQYGVTADNATRIIETYLRSDTLSKVPGNLRFTPAAMHILLMAIKIGGVNGIETIGTEHLLEAILRRPESPAFRVLLSLNIQTDGLLSDLKLATHAVEDLENQTEKKEKGRRPRTHTPTLNQYSRDLTEYAFNGQLDPVVGRDAEIERVVQILSRRSKNNPCLIGEPGVGKTAIVEGLALRIASGQAPDIVLNKRIVSLDLAAMIAGTRYRGEFEERIKSVLEEVRKDSSIILFIDELHTIIGAGSAEGTLDAANIIKPALSRGELKLIGATTISEYRKHIEKDAALERRFQPVTIEEPSEKEAVQILLGVRPGYEEHHKVHITDEALSAAVTLSKRYITDRFLPDKAIDVIDEACSKVALRAYKKPKNLRSLEEQRNEQMTAREEFILQNDFPNAAKCKKKIDALNKKILASEALLWTDSKEKRPVVTKEDIASVVSTWTKIPVDSINETEMERLRKLPETLRKRIVSQDEAVDVVSKAIRRGRVGLKDPKRPIGSFLFLGPTGVGKTELTKALTEAVFGSENAMIRIDMSEFMEKHSASKLIGAPPGYVGFDDGGQLSEKVRRNPYSVLLFDEIEKAHPDVFNLLLQVLDDGHITDSQGRTVDFKNTIIIMTSNIGAENIVAPKNLGFGAASTLAEDYTKMKSRVLDELKKNFKPEFLNRLDEILVFHSITKESMSRIVDILLKDLAKRAKEQLNLSLRFTKLAKEFLLEKGYDPKYGARPLRRAIQTYVEDGLSEMILSGKVAAGQTVQVSCVNRALTFKVKE